VHAKDTRIDPANAGANTKIETKAPDRFNERSWNYVTLGHGHDESWWQGFMVELRMAGYDDVLSIEHEDFVTEPVEGIAKTVDLLKRVALRKPASFALW
jgi:sugar phosphate isomerase/epimerase